MHVLTVRLIVVSLVQCIEIERQMQEIQNKRRQLNETSTEQEKVGQKSRWLME